MIKNIKKYILPFFLFLFLFTTFDLDAKKVSKKNALYTGDAIVEKETMNNAGSWFLVMQQCSGTFTKKWRKELGLLSWEDYVNFNKGYAKYASDYQVTQCDKTTIPDVKDWYTEILDYIKSELNQNTSLVKSNKDDENTKNKNVNNENNEDIDEKLTKLKSLFDKNLITQEEYDAKRKEILDAM